MKGVESSGEIKVLIFKPSSKRSISRSSSVTYTLAKEEDKKGGADDSLKLVNHNLRDIIVSASQRFNVLDRRIGDLIADNFKINLSISIENTLTGGLSFEVLGLSVDASHERTNTVDHELILTFKKKKSNSK